MGSILDVLPREGALFAGLTGAIRLPDGRVLEVSPGSARLAPAAKEPPHNALPGPDDHVAVRRPAYLDAHPLFTARPAAADPAVAFSRLWPRRADSDDYVHRDPYTGSLIRVAQAVRAAVGQDDAPLALSFRLAAPPQTDPEAAYQLRQAVQGMADAARMLRLPVLAGDLREGPISLEVFAHSAAPATFSSRDQVATRLRAGDLAALVGRMTDDLGGSLYLAGEPGFPPPIDLIAESRVLEIVQAAGGGTPLGRGGLLLTLARCCAQARLGVRMTLPEGWRSLSPAAVCFGEAQSRFLVFLTSGRMPELLDLAEQLGVPIEPLGTLGGTDLSLDRVINLDVTELQ